MRNPGGKGQGETAGRKASNARGATGRAGVPATGRAGVPMDEHDPEETVRDGMASEAAATDDAETMASTGNADSSFVETVAGAATGIGIDRAEATGTGGLSSGEDLDPVAEGDYWRENFRSDPYRDAEKPYDQSLESFLDRRGISDEEADEAQEAAEARHEPSRDEE